MTRLSKFVIGMIMVVVIGMTAAAYLVTQHVLATITASQFASCRRLNIHRWQDNLVNYREWIVDTHEARVFLNARAHNLSALEGDLRAEAGHEVFQPPTICALAIGHPKTYHPPTLLPFDQVSSTYLKHYLAHPPTE